MKAIKKDESIYFDGAPEQAMLKPDCFSATPKTLTSFIHRLRVIKSPSEQSIMAEASRVGSAAFKRTMQWSMGREKESDLAAKMEFESKLDGASGLAYVPVVAGGDRALTIHYVRNDRPIPREDGESHFLLMDAGAKMHYYCNDITRTWPTNGRFSAAQRELYDSVLRVQIQCIKALSQWTAFPGISLDTLNQLAVILFIDELGKLGFPQPERHVHQLFPHSIGHYLGMDLHDTPTISYGEALQAGMVITIEPGLYVPDHHDYPSRYRGMGIRIEDDILITASSCQVLTEAVPKHPEEIEILLASSSSK